MSWKTFDVTLSMEDFSSTKKRILHTVLCIHVIGSKRL